MKTLRVLYHLALADFLERARRYSFLLTLAVIIYLGVLVNNGTVFLGLIPGDFSPINYRGVFNSAWIGTMTVLVTNTYLFLFGFYLVSNCISRDVRTGVGQINTAMSQLTQLTQQNAAGSEELASTAEEMTAQSEAMRQLMSFFQVGEAQAAAPLRAVPAPAAPARRMAAVSAAPGAVDESKFRRMRSHGGR